MKAMQMTKQTNGVKNSQIAMQHQSKNKDKDKNV